MKSIDECMMCTKKHVLAKRMFIKGLNMSLSLQAYVEKTVDGVENTQILQDGLAFQSIGHTLVSRAFLGHGSSRVLAC